MKRHSSIYILLMLIAVVVTSCIRDEIADCPPLRVNIAVKDKNYFNVDKVEFEQRLSEDLPFCEYVPTLYWILRDVETGEIVDRSPLQEVRNDDKVEVADIRTSLPHGKYVLTVWGGLRSEEALGEDPTTFDLHRDHTELNDVYLTNDTLLYDVTHYDYTVELERIKGKLIIEKVNLPEEITSSQKTITGLFSFVDNGFKYTGETYVDKYTDVEITSSVVTKTVLTPSLRKEGSVLTLDLTTRTDILSPHPVTITMYRNEITVLRYVWVSEKKDFEIFILINDSWDLLNNLSIE